ncbi:MAG TPA: hypothetical protein DDW84_04110 [Phycisphaerales bacterium]|nr:hypothetical protein [Phycisphaerales bacterium]HBR18698.1 hypothetical protein [Phycisphaerales bacterium]
MANLRTKSAFFRHGLTRINTVENIYPSVSSVNSVAKNNSHRQRRFNSFSLFTIHFSLPSAFTLVEVLIVVAILGILAAIVVPLYEDNQQKAKESAAKENLRVLRNAIELYAAQHKGVAPGYTNDNKTATPSYMAFGRQMTEFEQRLSAIPQNPFNAIKTIRVLANSADFPTAPEQTGTYGWIYKPSTKQIRLNWLGKDSHGVTYYDY